MTADRSGEVAVPDKFYFKIGEVSDIAGVPSYVLRFWETEFKQIKPKRTEAGQRLYRRQDVALILRIKRLLYEKKFTIEGARQHLRQRSGRTPEPDSPGTPPDLTDIRDELIRIRDMIDAHRR